MADMVEVYHEIPWGCLLLGLVGHMGNFLDLEKLCGGFWLDGSLGDCRPVITIRAYVSKGLKSNRAMAFELDAMTIVITGHALGIWICGCTLFYKRELWASKSAGAHSTKSLKISGCKR